MLEEVRNMSFEELQHEVIRLRQEQHVLYNELEVMREKLHQTELRVPQGGSCGGGGGGAGAAGHGDATVAAPRLSINPSGRYYDVSLSVLVVDRDRHCRTVPLQAILNKSYNRVDERDADTPVVGAGASHGDGPSGFFAETEPRLSADMGRLSTYSVGFGSEHCESPDLAGGRQSTGSSIGSPHTTGAEHSTSHSRRFNVEPLRFPQRPASLDPDAIVSHHTLNAFRNMYGTTEAVSPISNYGNSVGKYIMQVFAKKNDFVHHHDDVEGFSRALIQLCTEVEAIVRREARHPTVASPAYVFGDIHGNFKDLNYFMENMIQFEDLRYTPQNFVFLGDYVDRGDYNVEVVALLFSMKVLAPHKVTLLRGNHEDTLVNGDMGSYGETSFRFQCRKLFGPIVGEEFWRKASRVFALLPLTCNIDGKIFCTHGGLPRYHGGPENRLELLKSPNPPLLESLFEFPPREDPQVAQYRQAATDVCWSDPADDESGLDQFGFGPNPRGNGVILFGSEAVDQFLEHYGFEYIFRAHQEKSDGVKLSKNARVFTIFSTSAYVGHQNGAGVVLVAEGKIRLIIKNPDNEEFE